MGQLYTLSSIDMRILVFIAVVFGCLIHTGKAQQVIVAQHPKSITGDFFYCMPDQLGNVFALSSSGQLKKYNANLDSMGVFNEVRRYGKLYSISADNSLRSLLYFKEYRIILVLDRLMQVVNKIDIRKANIFQAQAVAQGYDNTIWVFDEQESRLKKLDLNGKLLFETADLRLVFNETLAPSTIFDAAGFVYLYDADKGLYIFDYYGALKNRIALIGWTSVQAIGKKIIGLKNGKVMVYTPGDIDIKEMQLPFPISMSHQIRFTLNAIYVRDSTGITQYKWNK
jgi:hypothetical protein